MTVRTEQGEIIESGLLAALQFGQRLGVVTFDEAMTTASISHLKIEIAHLAN